MKAFVILLLISLPSIYGACTARVSALPFAAVPEGYGSYSWACDLANPRSILTTSTGEVLVVEAGAGRISCLWDDDNNGYSDEKERVVIATAPNVNHGIAINGGYLYASSTTTLYRWTLGASIRTPLSNPTVVVSDMPSGGHGTRTLVFDANNQLYISCGSNANVDPTPVRSLIRSFDPKAFPSKWEDGTVYANGMRNEVGIRFDSKGGLWGVENGYDNLFRNGVDIHNDNPGEEINYFGNPSTTPAGKFYGYPYCYSIYNLTGYAPKTQLVLDGAPAQYTDAWCQDTTNVVPPSFVLPAHIAPLDLIFYPDNQNSFSGVSSGDLFVTGHGSWNRQPPQGYCVYLVKFTGGNPVSFTRFFAFDATNAQTDADWTHRPVGMAFNKCQGEQCLLVSSDASASSQIIAIAPKGGLNWTSGASALQMGIAALCAVIVCILV